MKKALFFALLGLFSAVAPALAHPPLPANVNFTSERGVPFDLVLDGRLLTRGGARQVHVDRLAPGQHWADFTLPIGYGRVARFRSPVWLRPGLETTFVLIARPGRPFDLWEAGAVAVCGPDRGNGYGYGGAYNSPAPYGQGQGQGGNYPPAYPSNGNNSNYNPNGDGDDDSDAPTGTGTGTGNPPNGGGYYPGSATSSYRTLAPQDVDALLQDVQQHPFDSSKLSVAKDGLRQTSLPAEDLRRLLRSMATESSRVELAKFAYPHVADQQNFYRVYEAFQFDSSVDEVQRAVGAPPQR